MNNEDVTIGSLVSKKIEPNKWSKKQYDRACELCKRLKPAYKKINAENICNMHNVEKVLAMSKDFAFMNIRDHEMFYEYEALKPFNTHLKCLLLNYVIYSSAAGEVMYKEKLAKKVNASHKTVQKIIDDLVECGAFIQMLPHSEKLNDDRIINIRTSIDVTVAYIDYNVRNAINNLKFTSAWTKIKLNFEFDYDESIVA